MYASLLSVFVFFGCVFCGGGGGLLCVLKLEVVCVQLHELVVICINICMKVLCILPETRFFNKEFLCFIKLPQCVFLDRFTKT